MLLKGDYMKLIAIGDNVVDCYIDDHMYYPGGNALNVAVNCKRNGVEKVSYLGVFGDDEKAEHIKTALREEKVDYTRARKVYAPSAQPRVILVDGDRTFASGPRDTCQHLFSIKIVKEDVEFIKNFDICITSCYSNLEYELPTISAVCKIAFDFSEHVDDDYLLRTCPYLWYGFFSGADKSLEECKKILKRMHSLGCRICGATRGGNGQIFYDGEKFFDGYVEKVESVVDTMGAGDSFIAGFLTAHGNGQDIAASLKYAAKRAAATCLVHGAFGHGHPLD